MADFNSIEIQVLSPDTVSQIGSSAGEDGLEMVSSTEFTNELEEIIEGVRKANKFGVLLSGRTGTGKSTLVNGLVGAEVAEVSDFVQRSGMTAQVWAYKKRIKGLDVTVWDSPGLQDGTENEDRYLDEMASQCAERDLVLYCISMFNCRFVVDNMDIRAMKIITQHFGSEFWTNTLIVLTFANAVVDTFLKRVPEAEKGKKFVAWLSEWNRLIKTALIEEVGVDPEIANNVRIVPAGHQSERSLPGRPYWLSDLWVESLNSIPTVKGRVALLVLSGERLRTEKEVSEADFIGKPLHEQPIVLDATSRRRLRNSIIVGCVAGIAGAAAAGAAVGAGVGVAAAGLGVFVGLPVGLAVGVVTGTVGAVLAYKKTKKTKIS